MKKIGLTITISILVISVIMMSFVCASGFSPTSLIFNLNKGQEECKIITITSDSEMITVSDLWAENKDVEWSTRLFDKDASYHSISISYPELLSIDERQVEVCLSGSKEGEYHGVVLLKEEQKGNSIIQMGVWIKATISGEQQTSGNEEQVVNKVTISLDNAAAAENQNNQETPQAQDNQETNPTPETETSQSSGLGITGRFISGDVDVKTAGIVIGVIIIVVAIGILVYIKRRRRLKLEGYI